MFCSRRNHSFYHPHPFGAFGEATVVWVWECL